jgi:tetratricopeptide (TPR) repeat protein
MKLSVLRNFKFVLIFTLGVFIHESITGSIVNRDSLQNKLFVANEPAERIRLLNLLAESYINDNHLKSFNYAMQARSLSESISDYVEEAKALYFMSISNYKQENFMIAYNLMVESQVGFLKADDQSWFGKTCLELGKIYEKQYEFEKALETLLKASEIFSGLNDSVKLAETYNIIGINYFDQKNYDKAFEYFQNAMKIRVLLKDEAGLSSVYNNIGETYRY